MGIPRSWSGDGAQVASGGALGPEKLRRDFDHGFLTTVLIYFYCCIFMLLFVHFTTVIQTKWKTSIGLKNSAVISLKTYLVFGEDYSQCHAL